MAQAVAGVVDLCLRAVAASRSRPLSVFLWATFKNITRARGMPSRFQSLTLGIAKPNMRDTFAVPPRRSMICVAALFMHHILAQANQ